MSWEVVRSQELHHGTGTRSTPQSHNIIRARFTDEESQAQRACAGHPRSQSKSMERQNWDSSSLSSLFYPYVQAKLPTLQRSGCIPYISLQMGL